MRRSRRRFAPFLRGVPCGTSVARVRAFPLPNTSTGAGFASRGRRSVCEPPSGTSAEPRARVANAVHQQVATTRPAPERMRSREIGPGGVDGLFVAAQIAPSDNMFHVKRGAAPMAVMRASHRSKSCAGGGRSKALRPSSHLCVPRGTPATSRVGPEHRRHRWCSRGIRGVANEGLAPDGWKTSVRGALSWSVGVETGRARREPTICAVERGNGIARGARDRGAELMR